MKKDKALQRGELYLCNKVDKTIKPFARLSR